MAHLNGNVEAPKVCDDRHAEDADAAVAGHNHLRHGAHANSVAAQSAVHAIFGGSLKRRALCAYVHAVLQLDAFLGRYSVGKTDKLLVVRLMHIREAGTGRKVGAVQRMLGEEIDMVRDNHQVADLERGVHAAGGVTHEQCLDAKLIHHANRKRHLLHRVTLVVVETALHSQNVLLAKLADNQAAAVALDS